MADIFSALTGGLLGALGLFSSSKEADAQVKAGQATADATKYAADLANSQYQQNVALQMPSYRTGLGALGVYASALGLPGFALQSGGGSVGTTAGGSGYTGTAVPGAQDWNAFIQSPANADILRAYQANSTDPRWAGNPGAFAQWWYSGSPQDRPVPTTPGVAGTLTGSTLQQQNQSALQNVLGGTDIPSLVMAQPGYQTQLKVGADAALGSAAAHGTLHSGGTLKALDTFGQNTFGDYYNHWLNNLGSLSGIGTSTATNIANQGAQTANSLGSLAITGAQATGQAGVNAANSWGTGVGSLGGSLAAILGHGNSTSTAGSLGSSSNFYWS